MEGTSCRVYGLRALLCFMGVPSPLEAVIDATLTSAGVPLDELLLELTSVRALLARVFTDFSFAGRRRDLNFLMSNMSSEVSQV